MSFGQNLQFLRKMHRGMTQEQLAERLGVSRQTISKWEMDTAFPEMEKAVALCGLFSCSLDELLRQDMTAGSEAYQNLRVETLPTLRYVQYAVISPDPEGDAMTHMSQWAERCGIGQPDIIGWDFPFVSMEQINVFHMHGYATACLLPEGFSGDLHEQIPLTQAPRRYVAITVEDPFRSPFSLIPSAYKTILRYMDVNGFARKEQNDGIACFERLSEKNGTVYMDIYVAADG